MGESNAGSLMRAPIWDIALYSALLTLLGFFAAVQSVVTHVLAGEPANWGARLGTELLNWYTCGMFTPVYIWLMRRFPLRGPQLGLRIVLYLAILLLSVPVKYLIWVPLQNAMFHTGWTFTRSVVPNVFAVFMGQLYFIVFLYAVEYYRRARERALHAAQLETELSKSQLGILRSQMHPHFLFNTLHSISVLMHRDVDGADEMLSRLGDMLRASFASDSEQEIPLRKELELVDLYLNIMRVRFRDRLHAQVQISENVLDVRVPSFLLQPIVENAVRHGIEGSSDAINIHVTGNAEGKSLCLRVIDDGRGPPRHGEIRAGIGLGNTRRRMEQLYGSAGQLDILAREGGGTEVIIRIPRKAPRSAIVSSGRDESLTSLA